MGGLGIAQFLKQASGESGGSGQWLKAWKKNGKGKITVWLHTRAPIVPSFSHPFMLEDTYQDKETKREKAVLRYPRFISPDPEIVTRNQYFRNDDGSLQTPPDRDPFLILREWLRIQDDLSLEAPIFKWTDPKDNKEHVWRRGNLSGLQKRGKANFAHSLDTKHEFIFVVVDNENVEAGPFLTRENKLLSQKIVEVITQQRSQFGDDHGDPLQHPYAFTWEANSDLPPANSYKAYKHEAAELTDEVWEQISGAEFPDPAPHGVAGDGDMTKIRDAFEKAMQVELPLDQIFSDDPEERRNLMRRKPRVVGTPRQSKAAQSKATNPAAQRPPVPGKRPDAVGGASPASEPAAGPQLRRKKVDKPAPPPVETIPCEDCGTPMIPTATKCDKCGAEYEPIEDADAAPPPPPTKPKPTASSVSKPKPTTAKPTTQAKPQQQELPATEDEPGEVEGDSVCWSCQAPLEVDNPVCPSCGVDQGDDIPF